MTGRAVIIQGNALHLPLPNSSVDLICTSPPYFGLRSYQDAGVHYDGQIGSEATPQEFLDALLAATREMVRVLKPSGSIFVNLGDKYAGSRMDGSSDNGTGSTSLVGTASVRDRTAATGQSTKRRTTIPTKSLMGIPWRYAIRCIDQLGLILRAEIIWAKPNGLPESVQDRVRRSHETWFHFVTQPRYFAAVDEIRAPSLAPKQATASASPRRVAEGMRDSMLNGGWGNGEIRPREYDPRGKLPGSVWSIPTQPLTVPPELGVDHFAAYPMEWPRRIIQGWTPSGICTVCGEWRHPITTVTRAVAGGRERPADGLQTGEARQRRQGISSSLGMTQGTIIIGHMCGCPTPTAPTRPAVCLDPFGGTGTTALVAKALGRIGITIDLSADYCRLAEWRCNDPRELAAALQIEKPDVVPDDQLALFETP